MNYKDFNSLADYLREVDCINQGGCGIAAYFIYELFKEQGKKPEIVFWHRSDDKFYKKNYKAITTGKGKPVAPAHAMVKLNGFYYDADGRHTKDEFGWYWDKELVVNEKLLLESLKAKNWNDDFDRNQEVPLMEKKIGLNLPTS